MGAGKTTSLTNLLKNRDGLRIAVLVNDVASVNVDAQTLRRTQTDSGVEMVELKNGCVCCGPGADGLAPAVRMLANRVDGSTGRRAFDHVVIELSGVADPTVVQRNLDLSGVSIERKVALVDAMAFPALYNSVSDMGKRVDLAGADQLALDQCSVERRVVELLLVQIESADVILVNKCDLASSEEQATTVQVCRALNANAQIRSTSFGEAAVEEILPLRAEDIGTSVVCRPTGSSAAVNSVDAIGFATFVYRARRPFVQQRLFDLIQKWPLPSKELLTLAALASPGSETLVAMEAAGKPRPDGATFANVLRSKGTCWLDQQHFERAAWSHAGRHFRLTPGGSWWTALPDPIVRAYLSDEGDDTSAETDAYRAECAQFQGPWGDRRQELVFIGVGLDEPKIVAALDACLATDAEMDAYRTSWQPEEERLRASNGELEPFRFDAGDRVECFMGENRWAAGSIVRKFYREPLWPADRWMPYQVRLDAGLGEAEGKLIWAPEDSDECIRADKSWKFW